MKKLISILLAVVMIFTVATVAVAAVDYYQPFDRGTNDIKEYRIPALYTLNNGSVLAVADARYDHGSDSPNNIDIHVALSEDGYKEWDYAILNHFDDYADGVTDAQSASFIDSAVVQSNKNDKIFVISDVQPAGCGYLKCKSGRGYIEVNGKSCMLLTTGDNTKLKSFEYYIGEFEGELAPIYKVADNSKTEYAIDAEYDLYKNGVALTMAQRGSEGVTVNQNIFYADAEFKCFLTTHLFMRTSEDNGKTWSAPIDISSFVKMEYEAFLGICPGRGFVTTLPDGTERIIFMVYDNGNIGWNEFENVSTIYSDDNGATWKRGAETSLLLGVGKTSESQIIDLGNGVLRMFARNKGTHVAYADSYDYGVSWSTFTADSNLEAMGNCMVSFINTSKTINGKKVVLGSFPSNPDSRADGVIKVGLIDGTNPIEWISTYRLTYNSFFAYSCMTELADGNFAILYEDEASHIEYMIFSLDADGNIREINGNDPVTDDYVEENKTELTGWAKFVKFFKDLFFKIGRFFGLV